MNFYARLTQRFVRPRDPFYAWSGIHPLTTTIRHRITVDRSDADRAADPQVALCVMRFFFPDTPVSTWSAERRDRVALWKRLLAPPFTHRASFEYEISQPRTTRIILQIDLNLSGSPFRPQTTAKRLGRFLRYQFESVGDRWLLYRGQKAEFFWLMAIERKCMDLTRPSVDSPNEISPPQKRDAIGER